MGKPTSEGMSAVEGVLQNTDSIASLECPSPRTHSKPAELAVIVPVQSCASPDSDYATSPLPQEAEGEELTTQQQEDETEGAPLVVKALLCRAHLVFDCQNILAAPPVLLKCTSAPTSVEEEQDDSPPISPVGLSGLRALRKSKANKAASAISLEEEIEKQETKPEESQQEEARPEEMNREVVQPAPARSGERLKRPSSGRRKHFPIRSLQGTEGSPEQSPPLSGAHSEVNAKMGSLVSMARDIIQPQAPPEDDVRPRRNTWNSPHLETKTAPAVGSPVPLPSVTRNRPGSVKPVSEHKKTANEQSTLSPISTRRTSTIHARSALHPVTTNCEPASTDSNLANALQHIAVPDASRLKTARSTSIKPAEGSLDLANALQHIAAPDATRLKTARKTSIKPAELSADGPAVAPVAVAERGPPAGLSNAQIIRWEAEQEANKEPATSPRSPKSTKRALTVTLPSAQQAVVAPKLSPAFTAKVVAPLTVSASSVSDQAKTLINIPVGRAKLPDFEAMPSFNSKKALPGL